jgi:hypothetical protein
MLHRVGPIDLEQETSRVHAVPAACVPLLDHGNACASVARGDRCGRAGRTEPNDQDVDLVR